MSEQQTTGVRNKKQPLQKFDAKTSFEVWIIVSDAFFRDEAECAVKNGPKPLEQTKLAIVLKAVSFQNFEISHLFAPLKK